MNPRIQTINHKGKEILLCDFSTLMTKDFIALLDECFQYISGQSDLLILFDVTNASVFGEAFEHAKEFARNIKPHRKKSALIGISGSKQILLKSLLLFSGSSGFVQSFSDKEAAIDWLIQ